MTTAPIPVGFRKDGRPIYPIRGGSEPPAQPPAPPAPPAEPPAPPATPPAPRTFSQDEVTAIATRESQAAERSAQQKLLQELGVDSSDALKALVAAQRQADEAGKTELQRQQEAAANARREADAEKVSAAAERFEARVERAFASVGAVSDGTPEGDAKLARIRRMITVDPTADYAAVRADVDAIRTDFPTLFGGTTADGAPPAPPSDPKGKPPATPPGSKTAMERGAERAKARFTGSSDAAGGYIKPPGL